MVKVILYILAMLIDVHSLLISITHFTSGGYHLHSKSACENQLPKLNSNDINS